MKVERLLKLYVDQGVLARIQETVCPPVFRVLAWPCVFLKTNVSNVWTENIGLTAAPRLAGLPEIGLGRASGLRFAYFSATPGCVNSDVAQVAVRTARDGST